jgi:hypothetical protein
MNYFHLPRLPDGWLIKFFRFGLSWFLMWRRSFRHDQCFEITH